MATTLLSIGYDILIGVLAYHVSYELDQMPLSTSHLGIATVTALPVYDISFAENDLQEKGSHFRESLEVV